MRKKLTSCDRLFILLIVGVTWTVGCAPPPTPVAPGVSQFPNFLFPRVPESMVDLPVVSEHIEAWRRLQAGDLPSATAGFSEVLSGNGMFYPAETGLGYVDIAARRLDDALERFGSVLEDVPGYAPAWVGRGEALLASGREAEAMSAYESALVADSKLSDVRRRIQVLRFRSVRGALEMARAAEQAERYGEARQAYEEALTIAPDSGVLYRELALIERRLGELGRALEYVMRANDLEPDDAAGLTLQGDIHETLGDLEGAETAFSRAVRINPTPDRYANLDRVRNRLAAARLPPEYRAIPNNRQITRAELAAIVGVNLSRLLEDSGQDEAVLITDIRTHWAYRWILVVAESGIMEVFLNHTFQPENVVDRGGLAQVVSRVLTLIASRDPVSGARWQAVREQFADIDSQHLQYRAASMAVAAEVLSVLEDNRFGLTNAVTGLEALAAVEQLERLATP
ncbi:MAG TPA: tetratricopeptide repeat protein [Acidobacteria bacterium]|nr:tetratricopeptide repeat protein [Acidobacteriota bacterium]